MDFVVSTTLDVDRATVTVAGELDAFTAMQVRRRIEDALIQGAQDFTLEVSRVTFVDAAGLGVLVHLRNVVARRGGTVTVAGASPSFQRICTVTGLAKVFRLSAPARSAELHIA